MRRVGTRERTNAVIAAGCEMMIERLRQFLSTGPGKAIGGGVFVIIVVLFIVEMKSTLGGSTAENLSRKRLFICSETGKTFTASIEEGSGIPVHSPYSGKDTGYLPEQCFWTKDGQLKNEPTYVILNEDVGKSGPTFCPDCDHLVIRNNRHGAAGHPPPTHDEYFKRRGRAQ